MIERIAAVMAVLYALAFFYLARRLWQSVGGYEIEDSFTFGLTDLSALCGAVTFALIWAALHFAWPPYLAYPVVAVSSLVGFVSTVIVGLVLVASAVDYFHFTTK